MDSLKTAPNSTRTFASNVPSQAPKSAAVSQDDSNPDSGLGNPQDTFRSNSTQDPQIYTRLSYSVKTDENSKKPFEETKLPGEEQQKILKNGVSIRKELPKVANGIVDKRIEANWKKSQVTLKPLENAPPTDTKFIGPKQNLVDRVKGKIDVKSSPPGLFSKVMAPVSILTGGADMIDGVTRIQNGDNLGGAINLAKGTSSVTGGVLTLSSIATKVPGTTSILSTTAATTGTTAAATTLGKAIPIVGATTAILDGVSTTYDGYQKGDTEKTIVGAVKTAGGGMMLAGVLTGNPILAGAGVITYGAGVIYENREAIGDGLKTAGNFVANTTKQAYNATADLGKKVVDTQLAAGKKVLDTGKDLVNAGKSVVNDVTQTVVKKKNEFKKTVVDTARTYQKQGVAAFNKTKKRANQGLETGKKYGRKAVNTLSSGAKYVKDTAVSGVRQVKTAVVDNAKKVYTGASQAIGNTARAVSNGVSSAVNGAWSYFGY